MATWPTANQHPYNLRVELTISYPGGTLTSYSDCGGPPPQYKSDILFQLGPKEKYGISSFKVISSKFQWFNGGGEIEVDGIIDDLKNKKTIAPAGMKSPTTANNNNEQINGNSSSGSSTSKSSSATTKVENKTQNTPQLIFEEREEIRKQQEYNAAWRQAEQLTQTGEAIGNTISDILGDMQRAKQEREQRSLEKDMEKSRIASEQMKDLQYYLPSLKMGDQNAIKQVGLIYEAQIYSYKKERNKRTGKAIINPSLALGFGLGGGIFGSDYILKKNPFGEGVENEIAYYVAGIGGAILGIVYFFKSVISFAELSNYKADKEVYKNAKSGLERLTNYNIRNISFNPSYNPVHKMYGFNLTVGL